MNCPQAKEFVSAVGDGDRIPREAAQHLDGCETCRDALKEYAEIGAELRRAASLESIDETPPMLWQEKRQAEASPWGQKSWQTARIPRLALALMLMAIAGLSSSLLILKTHAAAARQILVLTIKASNGYGDGTTQCTMFTVPAESSPCYLV
jgi:predicted anti-sigma-YlaC factor YlaD